MHKGTRLLNFWPADVVAQATNNGVEKIVWKDYYL
jgi:hypothetical protein